MPNKKEAAEFDVSVGNIFIRINVDWPMADVDAVYKEYGGLFQFGEHDAQSVTPTAGSVGAFLDAVFHDEELKARGLELSEDGGLMMGCCHAVFEVEVETGKPIPDLNALAEFARERMTQLVKEHVRYYEVGERVKRGLSGIGAITH